MHYIFRIGPLTILKTIQNQIFKNYSTKNSIISNGGTICSKYVIELNLNVWVLESTCFSSEKLLFIET